MQGWLPWGLDSARAYLMSHHDIPNTRYNGFLPLFDFALGNSRRPTRPRYVALLKGWEQRLAALGGAKATL